MPGRPPPEFQVPGTRYVAQVMVAIVLEDQVMANVPAVVLYAEPPNQIPMILTRPAVTAGLA